MNSSKDIFNKIVLSGNENNIKRFSFQYDSNWKYEERIRNIKTDDGRRFQLLKMPIVAYVGFNIYTCNKILMDQFGTLKIFINYLVVLLQFISCAPRFCPPKFLEIWKKHLKIIYNL